MTTEVTAPVLFTTAELAAHLGLAPATLRSWRRLGTGPAYQSRGNMVFYSAAAVDAWLAPLDTTAG